MENDKNSISELIEVLVNPVNISERIHFYTELSNNENYVTDFFRKGEVDEKLLLHLLKKSVYSQKIKQLLPDILYFVDECSITDTIISFCITYPGRFRATLLSILAHMWLRVEHLELINSRIHTPEAFCKLFFIYADDIHCSDEKFHQFLCDNKHYLMDVDCVALINTHNIKITESKLFLLKK